MGKGIFYAVKIEFGFCAIANIEKNGYFSDRTFPFKAPLISLQ